MGGWAVAQSPILVTTITLKRLIQRGYESLLSYYESISPQLNEPLYTRPVAPMLKLRRKHTYSGVRGEPHQLVLVGPSTRLATVGFHPLINSPFLNLSAAKRWCH